MVLAVIKSWLQTAFSSRFLLLTNTLTGTAVMATGDFLHQHAQNLRERRELTTDWRRTARITAFSATFAPLDHFYFKWLDNQSMHSGG
ncbi:hypothetical protein PMAYCL1PPCAC_15961, partial [Pristionchus mayeri]